MSGRTRYEGLTPETEDGGIKQIEALNTFMQRAKELKSLGLFLLNGRNASYVMQGPDDKRLVISQTFDDTVRVHAVLPRQDNATEKIEGTDVTINGTVVLIDGMGYDQTRKTSYPSEVLIRFADILANTRENVLQMMDEASKKDWQTWCNQNISSGIGATSVVHT